MAVFRLMSSRESLSGHQFSRHTSSVSGSIYNRWKCVWTSCARGSGQEALRAAVAEWRQTEDKPSFHRAEAAYKINTAGRAFSVMNEPEPAAPQVEKHRQRVDSQTCADQVKQGKTHEKWRQHHVGVRGHFWPAFRSRSWRTRVKRLLEPEKKKQELTGSREVGSEFGFKKDL